MCVWGGGGSAEAGECFLFLGEPLLERHAFLSSGSVDGVFPVSLHLVAGLEFTGSEYGVRSGLYCSLKRFTSFKQLVLTIMEVGSNVTRCNPASVQTLDIAM